MPDDPPRATRRLPLIIGGLCVAGGVMVGIWPRGDEGDGGPPPATPTASVSVTASATAPAEVVEGPVPAYTKPDLRGPDVGEVVVASAVDAAGLAVVGTDMWWLSTEGATLARSRRDGAEPRIVFTPEDTEAVGGTLAAGAAHVFFSVPAEGAIYRAGWEAAKPSVFVSASAPELVLVVEEELWWVDGGAVWRSPTSESRPQRVANVAGAVTSLAARADGAAWLAAPLEPGEPHALGSHVGGTLRVAELEAAERDSLLVAEGVSFWAESRPTAAGDRGHLVRRPDGGPSTTLRVSGLISHLAVAGARLVWTEIYVEEETSLLFTATLEGEEVTRHGRILGFVTCLTAHEGIVYWSGPRGIERLRIDQN